MLTNPEEPCNWYALRIRSRHWRAAIGALSAKGYEVLMPTYWQASRWTDRIKQRELPLFPGYLFCRFDVSDRFLPILTAPGVQSIVCTGRTPAAIPDREIHAIQMVVRSGLEAQPSPMVQAGMKVYIDAGPLLGVEGIALSDGDGCRLIVSVGLLQRAVRVEIDSAWARPVISRCGPQYAAPLPIQRGLVA